MLAGFPAGPYSLATKYVVYRLTAAILALVIAVACFIGYGSMARNQAAGILHDERVWNAGGPDIPAGIEGNVTTRQFVLKSYDLTVQFVSPGGALQNKHLELTTLFGGIA